MPVIPTSELLKQENHSKSEASLRYLMGCRRTWTGEGDSVSKHKTESSPKEFLFLEDVVSLDTWTSEGSYSFSFSTTDSFGS